MYPSVSRNIRCFQPAIAGLMVALVLLLAVFAACDDLHHQLHGDASAPHHGPCAVCSVADGQVELPVVGLSVCREGLSLSWTLPALKALPPAPADFSVASSRGPPAPVSSV